MANAKIISFVDHEVAAALRLTAKDLTSLEAELRQASLAARAQATNDLRFVTDNLRHDINTLAAALNQLRVDVDKLRQDASAEAFMHHASQIRALRADVDQLKQGHQTVGGLHSVDQLKQDAGTSASD